MIEDLADVVVDTLNASEMIDCNPSRASFVFGLYPHTSQLYGFEKWQDNAILKNSRTFMDHFRVNGYHTLGTGKIMHSGERKEWDQYGNDADYSPLAHRDGKNVAHPDVPAPFRDDFESIDGSFGPLKKVEAPFSWKSGSWRKLEDFRYNSEDDRDLTADEKNGKWADYYDPAKQNYTLRDQEWRYIRYENGKEELYHVFGDPREWTNLALNSKYEKTLASYR